eukprot:5506019-Pyramimonas_sp.AAC.1
MGFKTQPRLASRGQGAPRRAEPSPPPGPPRVEPSRPKGGNAATTLPGAAPRAGLIGLIGLIGL